MKVLRQAHFMDEDARMVEEPIDTVIADEDLRFIEEGVGEMASEAFAFYEKFGPGYFLLDSLAFSEVPPGADPAQTVVDHEALYVALDSPAKRGHIAERLTPALRPWLESYDETTSFVLAMKAYSLYRVYHVSPDLSKPSTPRSVTSRLN